MLNTHFGSIKKIKILKILKILTNFLRVFLAQLSVKRSYQQNGGKK